MQNTIETVYIMENPEKNIIKFATDHQLRYNDIIKEVFGVACLNDLSMMIQFNKNFQDSICKRYGISENQISLNRIIHVASKNELHKLKVQLAGNDDQSHVYSGTVPRPFDTLIKLQEGIFKWDESDCSYRLVANED